MSVDVEKDRFSNRLLHIIWITQNWMFHHINLNVAGTFIVLYLPGFTRTRAYDKNTCTRFVFNVRYMGIRLVILFSDEMAQLDLKEMPRVRSSFYIFSVFFFILISRWCASYSRVQLHCGFKKTRLQENTAMSMAKPCCRWFWTIFARLLSKSPLNFILQSETAERKVIIKFVRCTQT